MFSRLLGRKSSEPLNDPSVPEGSRVYAVGDIHGRSDLLETMHGLIRRDAEAAEAAHGAALRKVVVYLGDYIDRGLESSEVVDLLLDHPLDGFEMFALKGNHEDALLQFLDNTSIGPSWLQFGGDATLYSYGIPMHGGGTDQRSLENMQAYLLRKLPARHREFFKSLRQSHIEGDYFFVHVGVLPGVPLEKQSEKDMLWIRGAFLDSQANYGKIIVHGHTITPTPVPEVLSNRIGIDTGAYSTGVLTCLALQGNEKAFLRT